MVCPLLSVSGMGYPACRLGRPPFRPFLRELAALAGLHTRQGGAQARGYPLTGAEHALLAAG